MNRRVFLLGLPGAALSTLGYATYLEPSWLEETQKSVTTGRRLRRPLRVAHLSDLHLSEFVSLSFLEEAFRRTLAMKPDLICLTGDFITSASDFDSPRYEAALQMLSTKAPTYAVLGNHDGGGWAGDAGGLSTNAAMMAMLAGSGVKVLHNEASRIEIDGIPLWLVGVGDWWSEELKAAKAYEKVPFDDTPVLLMNHNPDGKDDCAPFRWDLMLCGHTHGGQIVVPFYGPPIVPVIDRRYIAGLNPFENRWIHTTRGVGNISGVRVNCRPELSLLLVS